MNSGLKDSKISYWHLVIVIVTVLLVGGSIGAIVLNNKLQNDRQVRVQNELKKREEAQQRIIDQKAFEDNQKTISLNKCIATIDTWYNENSTGLHPQAYWDNLLASKKQQIQECQLTSQSNQRDDLGFSKQ